MLVPISTTVIWILAVSLRVLDSNTVDIGDAEGREYE